STPHQEGRAFYKREGRGATGVLLQLCAQLGRELGPGFLIEALGGPAEAETLAVARLRDDVEMHVSDGLVGASAIVLEDVVFLDSGDRDHGAADARQDPAQRS